MIYPFMTLENDTVITHSEMLPNGEVKVFVETPDEKDCFHRLVCYLPSYRIEEVIGYSKTEIDKYVQFIKEAAHLIIEFSRIGGFNRATTI